jgi:hypothetical protein
VVSRLHALALSLCALAAACSGCIVSSQCQHDFDCTGSERCCTTARCSTLASQGQCFVECTRHQDCWTGGVDNGKQCVENRCEFRFDQRVAALSFCLPVINPASGKSGQQLCLSELKGKVVMLYFGWIT